MDLGTAVQKLCTQFGISPEDYLQKTIADLYSAKQGREPVQFDLYRETRMPSDRKAGELEKEVQEFLPQQANEIAFFRFFAHLQPEMPARFELAFVSPYEDNTQPDAHLDGDDSELGLALLFHTAAQGCKMARRKPHSEVQRYNAGDIYAFHLDDFLPSNGNHSMADLMGEIQRGCGEIEQLIKPSLDSVTPH